MPYDVKMPQLGMNQDSAVIVAWLKAEGDNIASGDAICEVETDKATVEVEAASAGILAGIRATEGTDVPVGEVIAVIVQNESEVADHAGVATDVATVSEEPVEEPFTGAAPVHTPEPKDVAAPASDPGFSPPNIVPTKANGKVLASPKAKRLASEGGIDLAALRAQGIAEPIHATDLAGATAGGQSSLSARVKCAQLCALLDRSPNADRTKLFAAFAAGAWRAVFEASEVAIVIQSLDGTSTVLPNPDRGGAGATDAVALSLVDLCDTRLSGYASASGIVALSVAIDGEAYSLTLSFSENNMAMASAVALLDSIAARVEDPIRQLV